MGDLLSFLYTVVDTLSLIFFLDAFAQRRWDNRKFTLGIGCLVALNFWILQVPLVFLWPRSGCKDRHDPFVVHIERKSIV